MHFELRFFAELNDHLTPVQRQRPIELETDERPLIGEFIDGFRIPLEEVELILANGTSVGFTYKVADRDYIGVYPVFESFDVSSLCRIRTKPLRRPRFVLDVHLGKLARYLRMVGCDVLYRNDFEDAELIRISRDHVRTLLSKDKELLSDPRVMRGYHVMANHPLEQIVEVLRRFDLFKLVSPLQRCLRCNTFLIAVEKSAVIDRLPPMVVKLFDEFRQCPDCQKVYWKGSHYTRMLEFIAKVMNSQGDSIPIP